MIEVEGDLILQLKKDTISHLESQGPVIKKGHRYTDIRGEGSLELESADAEAISSDWNGEELDADHPSAVRLETGNLTFTGAGSGIVDETVELAGAQGTITATSTSGAAVKTAHVKREGSNSDKLELIGATAVAVQSHKVRNIRYHLKWRNDIPFPPTWSEVHPESAICFGDAVKQDNGAGMMRVSSFLKASSLVGCLSSYQST